MKAPTYKKPPLIPVSSINFHFRLLSTAHKIRLATILLVTFVSGCLGIIAPFNWVWYISLASFIIGVIDLYSTYFRDRKIKVVNSTDVLDLCSKLSPSLTEEQHGYQIIHLPNRNDSILISDEVNNFLRHKGDSISLELLPERSEEIIKKLQSNSDFYKKVLIEQHFRSRQKGRAFFNDAKISLDTTLTKDIDKANLFKSCYYLTYLTNDISTLDIENTSNKSEPDSLWDGIENFPYDKGNRSAPSRMKTLHASNMSNHLGANTIAFTSDGKMIIWRQCEKSMRSKNLLAPTGSGSLDYLDYDSIEDKTLNNLAIEGMQRELLEECHAEGKDILNIVDFIEKTKVIGFYRWLGKAGLPGFLGVSKLKVEASCISPNTSEVDNPSKITTVYPAENRKQLKESIKELQGLSSLSVPLSANLHALSEILNSVDPADSNYLDFIFL